MHTYMKEKRMLNGAVAPPPAVDAAPAVGHAAYELSGQAEYISVAFSEI